MAAPVEYRFLNRLTVDDVMAMVDDGLLEDVPFELLMGVLQEKDPSSLPQPDLAVVPRSETPRHPTADDTVTPLAVDVAPLALAELLRP